MRASREIDEGLSVSKGARPHAWAPSRLQPAPAGGNELHNRFLGAANFRQNSSAWVVGRAKKHSVGG